jgi:WD40 repeat protein
MPRELDSTSGSSICRSDGVSGHVSDGRTTTSLLGSRYPLATILLLAALVTVGSYLSETHVSSSPDRPLEGHTGPLKGLTFSPDGRTLASSSWDHTVRLWDLGHREDGYPKAPVVLHHDASRTATAFSPDGSLLVSVGDRSLDIWSCRPEYERKLERVGEGFLSASFSPDGRRLALGGADGTVRIWDMPSAQERAVFHENTGDVSHVVFSPDGKRLVSSSIRGRVVLWDVMSGAEIRTILGRDQNVGRRAVAFSPDGQTIAVGECAIQPRDVLLMDVETGAVRVRLTGHRFGCMSLAFSPDGRYLATAGGDCCVKLWDLPNAKELARLTEGVGCTNSLAFSPDGTRLAYCGKDENVRFWDQPDRPYAGTRRDPGGAER